MTSTVSSPTVQDTYGTVARALHWLVVALLTAQLLVAWGMPHIHKGSAQEGLVDWHLSIGTALMLVVVVRLIWRFISPTPAPAAKALWERIVARLTHELLYVLLLVIPFLGWAAANFFGFKVRLFGLIALPAIADNTKQWAHTSGDVHRLLTWVMLGLIALHVLSALWHYVVHKDRVLQRMLPGV
jgi:cytochrome b561